MTLTLSTSIEGSFCGSISLLSGMTCEFACVVGGCNCPITHLIFQGPALLSKSTLNSMLVDGHISLSDIYITQEKYSVEYYSWVYFLKFSVMRIQILGARLRLRDLSGISVLITLTLNVRGPSYLGLTMSISWLLMPWLLTPPGHQQPWYWLCTIGRFLSYLRKDFNYLRRTNVEKWHKMWIYVPSEKLST